MNVNGSSLANWWHNHLPKEDVPENKAITDNKETVNAEVI
jgi:hypothetical protein